MIFSEFLTARKSCQCFVISLRVLLTCSRIVKGSQFFMYILAQNGCSKKVGIVVMICIPTILGQYIATMSEKEGTWTSMHIKICINFKCCSILFHCEVG